MNIWQLYFSAELDVGNAAIPLANYSQDHNSFYILQLYFSVELDFGKAATPFANYSPHRNPSTHDFEFSTLCKLSRCTLVFNFLQHPFLPPSSLLPHFDSYSTMLYLRMGCAFSTCKGTLRNRRGQSRNRNMLERPVNVWKGDWNTMVCWKIK